MKINEQCLACLVNQSVKTANLVGANNREELYQKIFSYMSRMDYSKTNPEVVGENFRLIKEHTGCADPYKETKQYYNRLFMEHMEEYEEKIHTTEDAVKYAIVANIIDFNPVHGDVDADIKTYFSDIDNLELTINDTDKLTADIQKAESILYLGDNCGEICFDKLLIKKIGEINPQCRIYFGVRGEAVVNDNTEEDARFVGMDEVATIISNGDYSLGTILLRTSTEFQKVYHEADVVIAKGQANYESLSEEKENIYFLLMTKCKVIADDIGVKEKSLVCMKNRFAKESTMIDNKDVIARVQQMEQYMDEVSEIWRTIPNKVKEDRILRKKIKLLADYMDSGQWLKDYEADERGELPANLKRGVLSQDGLYNLICEVEAFYGETTKLEVAEESECNINEMLTMENAGKAGQRE